MAFDIVGFDSSYKVPRFAGLIQFGVGAISAASLKLRVLLVGMKTSAGSMVADLDVVRCLSEEDAEAKAGAGSQLARMAYKALLIPGVEIWMAAVAEPVGTAATATILIAGTWSTSGELGFSIAGETFNVSVGSGETPTNVATNIAAAFTGRSKLPVTGSSATATATVTCKNLGVQGKDWTLHVDKSRAPAGLTVTLTGSGALGTDRVKLGAAASGTGTESVVNVITKIQADRWARIAAAQNDVTNAALWEANVNAKAGPLSILLEHVVFGANGDYATTQTLAKTTLNAPRGMVNWLRNSESHPCEIAAVVAALRAATEGDDPVPDYDGKTLPGIAPQRYSADVPLDTELATALDNGITPLTTVNGEAKIVRAITTYCTLGSIPDYRCLDTGDAVFPDYAMLDLKLFYETSFRPANKYVQDDPPPELPELPSGVAHPTLWNVEVMNKLLGYFANNWIEDPRLNPPASSFNKTAKRIQSAVTFVVRRIQHQIGVIGRQQASA